MTSKELKMQRCHQLFETTSNSKTDAVPYLILPELFHSMIIRKHLIRRKGFYVIDNQYYKSTRFDIKRVWYKIQQCKLLIMHSSLSSYISLLVLQFIRFSNKRESLNGWSGGWSMEKKQRSDRLFIPDALWNDKIRDEEAGRKK